MFDLETAINRWKASMKRLQAVQDGDLADLEAYLRDKVDEGTALGLGRRRPSPPLGLSSPPLRSWTTIFSTPVRGGAGACRPGGVAVCTPLLWRNLQVLLRKARRQKLSVLIATGGLALGLAAVVFVAMLIRFETGYDRHHLRAGENPSPRGRRICRHSLCAHRGLRRSLPGIEESVALRRLTKAGDPIITAGENRIGEDRVYATDPSFFRIFTVDFRSGRPEAALRDSQSAVLTEAAPADTLGRLSAWAGCSTSPAGPTSGSTASSGPSPRAPISSSMSWSPRMPWPRSRPGWTIGRSGARGIIAPMSSSSPVRPPRRSGR